MTPPPPPSPTTNPPLQNLILGYLLIGLAWGFTTPFIRLAAKSHIPPPHPLLARLRDEISSSTSSSTSSTANHQETTNTTKTTTWTQKKLIIPLLTVWFAVTDLLRNWRYALPLLVNITGSLWFFLLVGKSELSLTVPITNSLAFLFTVLGDWLVEGRGVSKDTWIGMGLSLGGIALCVQSKI